MNHTIRFAISIAFVAALVIVLSGCATTTTLPEVGPEDCQIRAGGALTEGTASYATFGQVAANTLGGSVTVIGDCPASLKLITRTDSSIVCYGSDEWCTAAVAARALIEARLRTLLGVD